MDALLFILGIILLILGGGSFARGRRASRLVQEATQKYHWPDGMVQAGTSNYIGGVCMVSIGVFCLAMSFFI